jgi:hypothetical protein
MTAKEKHGIELVGKEMWVWDDFIHEAKKRFVVYMKNYCSHNYVTDGQTDGRDVYKNASNNNPNIVVGDKGFFWNDDESFYVFDTIGYINELNDYFAKNINDKSFKNFSYEKQSWM